VFFWTHCSAYKRMPPACRTRVLVTCSFQSASFAGSCGVIVGTPAAFPGNPSLRYWLWSHTPRHASTSSSVATYKCAVERHTAHQHTSQLCNYNNSAITPLCCMCVYTRACSYATWWPQGDISYVVFCACLGVFLCNNYVVKTPVMLS